MERAAQLAGPACSGERRRRVWGGGDAGLQQAEGKRREGEIEPVFHFPLSISFSNSQI